MALPRLLSSWTSLPYGLLKLLGFVLWVSVVYFATPLTWAEVSPTPHGLEVIPHAKLSTVGLQPLSEVFKYKGQVLRWNFATHTQNPSLKLYWVPSVPFQGFQSLTYTPMIREAAQAWLDTLAPVFRESNTLTTPYVKAVWVKSPEEAHIHVKWVYQITQSFETHSTFHPNAMVPPRGTNGYLTPYQMATTEPVFEGGQLKHMKLIFSTHKASGHAYTPKERYHMILHEMGHALGLMGHSRWAGSLMRAGFTPSNQPLTHPSLGMPAYWIPIPESDKQHLQTLYRTPADLTNNVDIATP